MIEEVHYRPAVPADVLKLSILYQQVYIQTYGTEGVSDEFANFISRQFAPPRLLGLIESDPQHITVAEYRDNLVGVSEIGFENTCPVRGIRGPELNKLYILEWFCGKGIGEGLLRTAEDICRERAVNELWLWVLASNKRAISFYKKHQYQPIGHAPFAMEKNTYDNVVMLKTWQAEN